MTKDEIRLKFIKENPDFFESTHTYTSKKYKKYRKNYIKRNKQKVTARIRLNTKVRSGKILKENCKVCDCTKSQAHHPDYSKPLEVIWLCPRHHTDLHKGLLTLS